MSSSDYDSYPSEDERMFPSRRNYPNDDDITVPIGLHPVGLHPVGLHPVEFDENTMFDHSLSTPVEFVDPYYIGVDSDDENIIIPHHGVRYRSKRDKQQKEIEELQRQMNDMKEKERQRAMKQKHDEEQAQTQQARAQQRQQAQQAQELQRQQMQIQRAKFQEGDKVIRISGPIESRTRGMEGEIIYIDDPRKIDRREGECQYPRFYFIKFNNRICEIATEEQLNFSYSHNMAHQRPDTTYRRSNITQRIPDIQQQQDIKIGDVVITNEGQGDIIQINRRYNPPTYHVNIYGIGRREFSRHEIRLENEDLSHQNAQISMFKVGDNIRSKINNNLATILDVNIPKNFIIIQYMIGTRDVVKPNEIDLI